MKKLQFALLAGVLAVMGLGACGQDGLLAGGSGSSRTIEVDYQLERLRGVVPRFLPARGDLKPGMTVKFHQTWTGEPHSVSFGTLVDKNIKGPLLDLLDDVAAGKAQLPDEPPDSYDPKFWDERMPELFAAQDGLSQAAAHPCYVEDGDGPAAATRSRAPRPTSSSPSSTGSTRTTRAGSSRSKASAATRSR